jgi:hypothetical protein
VEEGQLAKWWQALADDNAAQALAAIHALAAAPAQSVAWIKEKIKPAGTLDSKHVEVLIARLNDDQYSARQKANAELLHLGERVLPALETALAGNPALETRLRIQDLHKRMTGLVLKGERLRAYRAVEVLERIGNPEARQVLHALADGAPAALVTTQAQGALRRLER